jgi:multiple sugar transport system substrate-binding protein
MVLSGNVTQDEAIALWSEGGFSENENARAVVEAFVELREAGVFADNAEGMEFNTMNELFFSGEAAMMHGGAWSYGELPEELLDSVVLGGFPTLSSSPVSVPAWWSGFTAKGFWISRNGHEKLDVIEPFIKFFYQPEVIARFVEGGGLVPPITGVEVSEEAMNPLFIQSLELAESGDAVFVPLAELYVPGPVSEPLDGPCTDVYVPGMSADEILAAMDETYEYMQ